MDFMKSMMIAASGMRAQGARMKVLAENIANADSLATEKGKDPYRRKIPVFSSVMDKETGVGLVQMKKPQLDQSDFGKRHDPSHPAADEFGYVMPDLKFLEIRSKMMTTTIVRDEIITNKKATKDDEAKSNVRRCCYPCSAAEYNKSPGDAVFGEPQSEENRLRDLFRPLNMPYKNFENRRAYADGSTAKTGGRVGK